MKVSTASTPALPTTHADDRLYMPTLGQFKACGLVLGLLVGLFIYLSTLGAEFIAVMMWGKDILAKSNQELILFSLGWNLATTFLALVILTCLRRMVITVFATAIAHRPEQNADKLSSELLSYLEGRFAVGALVGICVAWNVTNCVLGMRPQIIQSCVILAVACMWCRVTLILLGTPSEALIYDDQNPEDMPTTAEFVDDEDAKLEPLLKV